eukprot:142795-Prorocentrum_minimum.AAC.1
MTHFPVLLLLLRVCFAPSSIALAFLTLVRLALLSESERLGVGSLVGLRAVAEVEVAEHDVAVGVKQHVLGLQVAVDVAEKVQVLQRQQHLRGVEAHVRFAEALLRLRH